MLLNKKQSSAREQLAELRCNYINALPAKIATIQELAASLKLQQNDQTPLQQLHQDLHKIAGSGATFGFTSLSTHARRLEKCVKNWLGESWKTANENSLHEFVTDVGHLIETLNTQQTELETMPHNNTKNPIENVIEIWLIQENSPQRHELSHQLESFGYQLRIFSDIDQAEDAFKTGTPELLLLDMTLQGGFDHTLNQFERLHNIPSSGYPIIFISEDDDFQSRVRAAKFDVAGYFLKPLDIPRLVNRMTHIFEKRLAPPPRVLIVEDDDELAQHYKLTLLNADMKVQILKKPETIIEELSSFRPELVLLDLYMPNFSGQDLAGVIRQHDKWASLPVVYLSGETDINRQIGAMHSGADDFLTKPISDAQLVTAVRVRIERARELAIQLSRDSLTGLLKHGSIKEAADIELIRSQRTHKPVSLIMLDIDDFKTVNDSYGHAVGDMVMSSLAMLLRQRLRRSDIIGRYGGDEFVIVLPECDIDNAHKIIEDLRQRFASVHLTHEGKSFSCTFSAGLACSSTHPGSLGPELLLIADIALYTAKRNGRNQVKLAEPNDSADSEPLPTG